MAMTPKVLVPSKDSQESLLALSNAILTEHKKFTEYFNKMEAIDVAYARYKSNIDPVTGVVREEGIDAATTPVGVHNMPSTTPPVVISQVDSMVGYLADVFLSGSPLFPIVSNPRNKAKAEQLETLIDDHATLGGYARQLLMFLRDGVKYNFSAIEAEWAAVHQYTIFDDFMEGKQKLKKDSSKFTRLKRLDPYNTVWDRNVMPGDVSLEGDYAGYLEILSRTKMKRFLNALSHEGKAFNVREALASKDGSHSESFANYRVHPQVSNYISPRRPIDGTDWQSWMTGSSSQNDRIDKVNNFEVFTFYARIMPSEYKLVGPEAKTPQIWKIVVVNNSVVVRAERIISAYDYLPILFGQPLEDGLGYQTQSVAEANIPFQTSAATLFNIRFNAARRAVSDRALYDPDVISAADVNAPVPAAKIPVKSNSIGSDRKISDAYFPIPFDARGTEAAFQDGMQIVGFSKELSGLNNPMQGKFQKGNKSVREWEDTMSGADSRLRLPALCLEYQVFMPLKEILKLNIYQYGEDAQIVSQKSGETITVNIEELKKEVLSFRVADGYTPKSKLASTDSLMQLMQIITGSQILQQQYAGMLPSMLAHLAQLMGVRGMEEYTPKAPEAQTNMLAAAQMQNGIDPRTGQPMLPQLPPGVQ